MLAPRYVSRDGDDGVPRLEKAAGPAAAPAYRPEQRAEIERSLRHLQPGQAALDEALQELEAEARSYHRGGTAAVEKHFVCEWDRVAALSHELMRALGRLGDIEGRPPDGVGWYGTLFSDEARAVANLNTMARNYLARAKADDKILGLRPRVAFLFRVLEIWTQLGGMLRLSRHPRTNRVTGPLARYFAAATQPVIGGSLESLPDIVRRQKIMASARDRWRTLMRQYDANERANILSWAGTIDWGDRQDEVKALLADLFGGNGDEP
jgi:hypothetical protein